MKILSEVYDAIVYETICVKVAVGSIFCPARCYKLDAPVYHPTATSSKVFLRPRADTLVSEQRLETVAD